MITAYYVTDPKQHLCIHYREVPFFVVNSRTSVRTIEGSRTNDAVVDFEFEALMERYSITRGVFGYYVNVSKNVDSGESCLYPV